MTKTPFPFKQIDVFTQKNFSGNPVAVIFNADKLTTKQMQNIANWIHLSETTFICQPKNENADYKLRIFSPQNELPFAGHPTIGSAYAALEFGITPKNSNYILQECKSGLIKIYLKENKLFLTLPKSTQRKINSNLVQKICAALGTSSTHVNHAEIINVGAIWYTIELDSASEVLSINPDFTLLSEIIEKGFTGVTIFGKKLDDKESNFEVRSFAPNEGANEDPVCGSGNGCVAILVKKYNLYDKNYYVATQGVKLNRCGKVEVAMTQEGDILIGGHAITCISGQLSV
ncbi:PhzF family phenazine biosynthesis protein [Leuconostoc falkenbergense]|uniref:PhzF family phenazine biosynthesis protein n=1 Tax=Leuconostoc falkenbergense TaxID=2766470 RepID=UPI0024AD43EF|nr:PhzF family phenazine biosynthesis protein [Leuconostoc falkenbergense]MDI6666742.1 PhzF family phenazine biosynthesis protein [Leuconostoc falkenbergense]